MRYSASHKQTTHERLLKLAAREIRARGTEGVSVAGVMARAGLTHGGFYAHFASREAMIDAAVETMFADMRRRFDWANEAGLSADKRMLRYIDFYLSQEHRDHRESGCPLPSLPNDLARDDGQARRIFGEGLAALTQRMAGLLAELGEADAPTAATALVAELVGAVALARAVDDRAQSDAILARTRAAIARRYRLEPAE